MTLIISLGTSYITREEYRTLSTKRRTLGGIGLKYELAKKSGHAILLAWISSTGIESSQQEHMMWPPAF